MWVKYIQESGEGRPQLVVYALVHLVSLCIFTVLLFSKYKNMINRDYEKQR